MKVWKSPVFYLGLFLVAAVIAALVAPFVINWNSYRADLEEFGRRLTGRDVVIDGPISVQLFPWPTLTADDIRVANPPEFGDTSLAEAARVVARLNLAGLFSGTFEVQRIEADAVNIRAVRTASGNNNWRVQPTVDFSGDSFMARVKLDQISLRDVTFSFSDERRGVDEHVIKMPVVSLASPGLAGPWRLTAKSASYGEREFDFNLSTGAWRGDEPFRFSISAMRAGTVAPTYSFDGSADDGRITGEVRIETAAAGDNKTDAEGNVRPLLISSKVDGTFDALNFDKIEIAPLEPGQGGTLVNGSAKVTLGAQVSANVDLSANKLDASAWAGAEANRMMRDGGGLALAEGLLRNLPPQLDLSGSMRVTSLQVGKEQLENAVLRAEASRDAIRIHELAASLPGRSRVLFEGVFFPGAAGAELGGNLALETSDLRELASWSLPAARERIAKDWLGNRGRLKLQSELSITPARLRLTKADYELDGERGSGDVTVSWGGRGAVDVRLDLSRLDLESYLGSRRAGIGDVLALFMPKPGAPDVRLTLQSGSILLNGVEADDVAMDVAIGANGLDLRTVEIGSVGGARLEAAGLVLDSGSGPDGAIEVTGNAIDPRGLIRLFGLVNGDTDPEWTKALGVTAFKGTVKVKTRDGNPAAEFSLDGTSGNLSFIASAGLKGSADPAKMQISDAKVDLTAVNGATLAKLAGLTPVSAGDFPAQLHLEGNGTLGEGIDATAYLEAFGARLDFAGRAQALLGNPEIDGSLKLRSTDLSPLAAAIGLPVPELPSALLVLDGNVGMKNSAIAFTEIAGRYGDSKLGGSFAIAEDGKMSGDLTMGAMRLADVLSLIFVDWNGETPSGDTPFAATLPFRAKGEFWIRPKSLWINDSFTAKDVQIGLTADGREIRMSIFGKDETGNDASVEIASTGSDADRAIEAQLKLPVDLARQLRLADGALVAEGKGYIDMRMTGQGRSPGGAIASLKGGGNYNFSYLRLLNISPDDFAASLKQVKDATGLVDAFKALSGGDGLNAGPVKGSITIENGVASFFPFVITTPAAEARIKTVAELEKGELDASVTLTLKSTPPLPSMEIAFSGPADSLLRIEEKTELATKLGYDIMQQGVAELERLQEEQKRLALIEEQRRKEDEEKLAAYYAQRDELLLRRRELKVHSALRLAAAERQRARLESERIANTEINKQEVRQRVRELQVHRRLQKLAASDATVTLPPLPKVDQPPARKQPPPKPKRTTPQQPATPIFSPPPSQGGFESPSQ